MDFMNLYVLKYLYLDRSLLIFIIFYRRDHNFFYILHVDL